MSRRFARFPVGKVPISQVCDLPLPENGQMYAARLYLYVVSIKSEGSRARFYVTDFTANQAILGTKTFDNYIDNYHNRVDEDKLMQMMCFGAEWGSFRLKFQQNKGAPFQPGSDNNVANWGIVCEVLVKVKSYNGILETLCDAIDVIDSDRLDRIDESELLLLNQLYIKIQKHVPPQSMEMFFKRFRTCIPSDFLGKVYDNDSSTHPVTIIQPSLRSSKHEPQEPTTKKLKLETIDFLESDLEDELVPLQDILVRELSRVDQIRHSLRLKLIDITPNGFCYKANGQIFLAPVSLFFTDSNQYKINPLDILTIDLEFEQILLLCGRSEIEELYIYGRSDIESIKKTHIGKQFDIKVVLDNTSIGGTCLRKWRFENNDLLEDLARK